MVYEFIKEAQLDQYYELISYACRQSDAVMMVFSHKKSNKLQAAQMRRIRKELSPWRIKTRHDSQWPVTESDDKSQVFAIDLYKPCEAIEKFLKQTDRLFGWGDNQPYDIAFFREHNCWLATCSHEKFGWIISEKKLPPYLSGCVAIIENPNNVYYYEDY